MNAVVLALAVASAVNDRAPGLLQIDIVLCQGDPLGSRVEGTLKYLAEPRIVVEAGRPACFVTGWSPLDDELDPKRPRTRIDLVATSDSKGKLRVEVKAAQGETRARLPGQSRFVEQTPGLSRLVAPGEKFRFRIAADSPGSQTWAEVTVTEYHPEK
jgi:hypothetical protein